ncbi:hypothetical protein WOLCODRAFT_157176 [Wolfiporia cocos MD-104 SS10]|uniref:Uncharacterized protein n=1 Tax=Wolfiporia cocos (strain MD-104) TaxID=742152 RepID=A0A2H3JCL0_WOLCO|nr:hypothetical protein WOLCODRAFT_157176 [Wolfiporia cocos MD-104 SS10]
MQRFNQDLPTRLIETLPKPYRRIFYEEKYEWRDPPTGFFTKGGYLTVPNPDRLSPTWVQVPPVHERSLGSNTHHVRAMDNNREDRRRTPPPLEEPWVWQVQPLAAVLFQEAEAQARAQGEWPITLRQLIIRSLAILSEQPPPEQERLEEEEFLEGEVPQAVQRVEVPRAAQAIQQAAQEAIQQDRQEEARQEAEAHQAEEPH